MNTETKSPCLAALTVAGEHFPCDVPAPHDGWAHANQSAEAIWASDPEETP